MEVDLVVIWSIGKVRSSAALKTSVAMEAKLLGKK